MKKTQPEKNFIPRKKKGGQSKFAAHLQMRLNTHLAEKNLNNISWTKNCTFHAKIKIHVGILKVLECFFYEWKGTLNGMKIR